MKQFKKSIKKEALTRVVYSFLGLGSLIIFLFLIPINMSVILMPTTTTGEFTFIKVCFLSLFFGVFLYSCFRLWRIAENTEGDIDVHVRK